MGKSSIDRVSEHLRSKGANAPAPQELHDDVEALVRRCDEVRSLSQTFGGVELSPFMQSLLRVSGLDARANVRALPARHAAAAGL